MSSPLQAKDLEYWSPAPLPEGDAGKNAAAPANLKEPEAVDLEVSSDSSVGGDSDVEVIGDTVPLRRDGRGGGKLLTPDFGKSDVI